MTSAAHSLLEQLAGRLRRRFVATLVAAVGTDASKAPKIVRTGVGSQHVMLQTALEDFATSHGFQEIHDFDELLPDVLASSAIGVFVGEACVAQLLRPGRLNAHQRVEACVAEVALVVRESRIQQAMLAVGVDTQREAELWLVELLHLALAVGLVFSTPPALTQPAVGVWIAAGVVTTQT